MTQLSVIIPVFNEAECIQPTLAQFQHLSSLTSPINQANCFGPTNMNAQESEFPYSVSTSSGKCRAIAPPLAIEVIVVDGGSQDDTVALAEAEGVRVIHSSIKGRAQQMNQGAAAANGEILLFLHADTQLPPHFWVFIQQALTEPGTIAGAFELKIDSPSPALRWIEGLVQWRSRFLALPYGDQALFLKASVFQAQQGYADLPIMEDFELIQRLRALGQIAIVPAPVLTSSRRWHRLGICRTTLINQLVVLGYYLRIPPQLLVRLYGR